MALNYVKPNTETEGTRKERSAESKENGNFAFRANFSFPVPLGYPTGGRPGTLTKAGSSNDPPSKGALVFWLCLSPKPNSETEGIGRCYCRGRKEKREFTFRLNSTPSRKGAKKAKNLKMPPKAGRPAGQPSLGTLGFWF